MAAPARTRTRWRWIVVPLTAALLAQGGAGGQAATGDVTGASSSAATMAVPGPNPDFPSFIEPPATWERESGCWPVEKPGARDLRDLLRRTYGTSIVTNTVRGCTGNDSGHEEGRAVDWMTDVRDPDERAKADAFLRWLLAADRHGNPHAMARRLGVMYVIWNSRKLYLWDTAAGWTEYSGCLTRRTGRKDDTSCHRNHVHISLSWRGANRQGTWWTLADGIPSCPTDPVPSEPVLVPARGPRRSIAPITVFQNTTAVGTPGGLPCQVPTKGRLRLTVSGGRVPTGIAEAVLEVRASGAKQSTWVALGRRWRGTGTTAVDTRLSVSPGRSVTTRWIVRLGPSGRIELTTGSARSNLRVRLVGYRTAHVVQPGVWSGGAAGSAAGVS